MARPLLQLVIFCFTSAGLLLTGAYQGLSSRSLEEAPRVRLIATGGTIATRSGLVFGDAYELALEDPVLNRTITASYRVRVLPQYL